MFKRLRTYWEKSKVIREVGSFDGKGLICAVEDGKYASLGVLIDAGTSLQSRDSKGNPALIRAIQKEQFPAMKMLIEAGADIDVRGSNQETPLMVAIRSGNRQIFAYLMEQQPELELCDVQEETALFKAIRSGNTTFARKIIEAGSEVDLRNCQGETPLMLAADHQKVGIVKSLLQAGADPNIMDTRGQTVLNRNHLSPRLQKMLHKAAREHQGTYQPPHQSMNKGVGGMLAGLSPIGNLLGDWLIEAGQLLHKPDALNILQKRGINLLQRWEQQAPIGITDLSENVSGIQQDTQHWLKEVLAQFRQLGLSIPGLNGQKLPEPLPELPAQLRLELQTALQHLTEFIAAQKASPAPQAEPESTEPDSPPVSDLSQMLGQAIAGQAPELVERVLNLGADPNAPLGEGKLPLHLAVAMDLETIALLLLEKEANPLLKDQSGRTALGYSSSEALQSLLLQYIQPGSTASPSSEKEG